MFYDLAIDKGHNSGELFWTLASIYWNNYFSLFTQIKADPAKD